MAFDISAQGMFAPMRDAAQASIGQALAQPSRAVYVGSAGDLVVTMAGGQLITFSNVQPGTFYPLQIIRVEAGTTAGGVVVGW